LLKFADPLIYKDARSEVEERVNGGGPISSNVNKSNYQVHLDPLEKRNALGMTPNNMFIAASGKQNKSSDGQAYGHKNIVVTGTAAVERYVK
jgi:hypothetical protein